MEIKSRQLVTAVVVAVFILLFGRLFQLQVIEGAKYHQIAEENAARIIAAPAPRGVVYDRHGQVLVVNRPVFSVRVLPQVLAAGQEQTREKVLQRLSRIIGEPIRFTVSADQPIIIKDNVDLETALRIAEQQRDLPGVLVSARPVRDYPYNNLAAHLLGYIGEIESQELKKMRQEGYRLGDVIGKDGIEKEYDKLIRGVDGGMKIEIDVAGRPTRLVESLEPKPGADVKLTVDLQLQAAVEKALAEKAGAVVVLDPNKGEILALASRPDYDPNLFISTLDLYKWQALAGGHHPFLNRALAIYPPGSIFKVVTLSAALQEGLTKPQETFYCPGYYKINDRIAKCWKETGHGRITAQEGLTQSCDVVFYELGRRLGPDRLARYARDYGLGERTGLDIPQEKKGLIPDSAWKKQRFGEKWYEGDSINYGIGQGWVQVTPLQMALLYGAIATGKRMKPFIVSEIINQEGKKLYQTGSRQVSAIPVSQDNVKVIRKALFDVVERATGRAAKIEGLTVAGKTGTAQTPGLPHAWFLCYAPTSEPKIVIAAFVEHGEHGDRSAANVAKEILLWYNSHRLQPAAEPD